MVFLTKGDTLYRYAMPAKAALDYSAASSRDALQSILRLNVKTY